MIYLVMIALVLLLVLALLIGFLAGQWYSNKTSIIAKDKQTGKLI